MEETWKTLFNRIKVTLQYISFYGIFYSVFELTFIFVSVLSQVVFIRGYIIDLIFLPHKSTTALKQKWNKPTIK